jgi:two-component system chemotaxis sensor kinase CheA
MDPDFSPELQKELLDDFYVESDEHLGNIRQQLALMEAAAPGADSDAAAAESLYRSFHSFKGISGMVGLRNAERLAHAAEDLLRAQSATRRPFPPAAIELLGSVTQRLEELVTAHRRTQPLPEVSDLLRTLAATSTRPSAAVGSSNQASPTESKTEEDAVAGIRARGLIALRCRFQPTRDLDARGINVGVIRARLGKLGEILSATPAVRAGGSIEFEFLVAAAAAPDDVSSWGGDGVVIESVQPPEKSQSEAQPDEPRPIAVDSSQSLFIAPSHLVRVELSRLDELMESVGEMVILRAKLDDRIAQLGGDHAALREVSHALARSLRHVRASITRLRLVPVAEIFTRMPFVVRDLARVSGKRVRLRLEGQQTAIDKYLVERLKEPLLHLVRNAVIHGIEPEGDRVALGKPPEASLRLSAEAAGDFVHVFVEDDGHGVDPATIAARAVQLGIRVPDTLDDSALLQIMCTPGFSMREQADLGAGRGVGMAVVATTARELGGSVTFQTTPGRGSRFGVRVPLTLSVAETIIVSAGRHTCAVPQASITEIITLPETQVRRVSGAEVIPYRDGVLPLLRLRTMFGDGKSDRPDAAVLVLASERGSAGLVVDRVHTQREIVVRPLQDPLLQVRGIFGATELGDGRPVLIVDPVALTSRVVRPLEPARN